VQAAPSGIAVRCGDYFTYPATTPGALTLHDQARRDKRENAWPACLRNSAEQWSTQTAGYEAFSSIAYKADLWNIKTVFPDLEAQVEADKLTIPPAIYGANQFIQQAVQAKVPAYILTPPAAVTTGLHYRAAVPKHGEICRDEALAGLQFNGTLSVMLTERYYYNTTQQQPDATANVPSDRTPYWADTLSRIQVLDHPRQPAASSLLLHGCGAHAETSGRFSTCLKFV
jgi:hypothetical protein